MLGREPDMFDEFIEGGIISPARMRAVDANAMALGVTELQLMESAGRALADIALAADPESVLVLCGKGNNGGDGMVAARYLQRGVETDVCYLDTGNRTTACGHQLAALKHCRVALHPFRCRDDIEALQSLFERADIIIDALLGIGASGALTEPLKTCVAMANDSKVTIIAADVPTPGMRADRICAFHRAKIEGSTVIDIGIPVEAECFTGPGDLTLLPARNKKAHKGVGGRSAGHRRGAVPGCPVPCRARCPEGRCGYRADSIPGLRAGPRSYL